MLIFVLAFQHARALTYEEIHDKNIEKRMYKIKSNINITNCEFRDLKTEDYRLPNCAGAAIYTVGCNCIINNTKFYQNMANMGGAIFMNDCVIQISNSLFHSNTAEKIGGAFVAFSGDVSLEDTYFYNNEAGEYHGAAFITQTFKPANIINCGFDYNRAKYSSGALAVVKGDLLLRKTYFVNNIAGFNNKDPNDPGTEQEISAGALWFQGKEEISEFNHTLLVQYVRFMNNTCPYAYGKDGVFYGCVNIRLSEMVWTDRLSSESFLTISLVSRPVGTSTNDPPNTTLFPEIVDFDEEPPEIVFDFNTTMPTEDSKHTVNKNFTLMAMKKSAYDSDLLIDGSNSATSAPKEVYSQQLRVRSTITVNQTTFINCISFGKEAFDERGGGIAIYFGELNIEAAVFTFNKAKYGGGIYASSSFVSVLPTTKMNTFAKNEASEFGACLFFENTEFSIYNGNFSYNQATQRGAISFLNSTGIVSNTYLWNNTGGALSAFGYTNVSETRSNITLMNICFSFNNHSKGGADIYVKGLTTVEVPLSGFLCSDLSPGMSFIEADNDSLFEWSNASATFGGACSTCRIAPTYQPGQSESTVNKESKKLDKLTIILISVAGVILGIAIISAVAFIFVIMKKKKNDDDSYYSDEETTFTTSVVTLTNENQEAEFVGKSLNNPLCSVSMAHSSDSLFDDIDDDISDGFV